MRVPFFAAVCAATACSSPVVPDAAVLEGTIDVSYEGRALDPGFGSTKAIYANGRRIDASDGTFRAELPPGEYVLRGRFMADNATECGPIDVSPGRVALVAGERKRVALKGVLRLIC